MYKDMNPSTRKFKKKKKGESKKVFLKYLNITESRGSAAKFSHIQEAFSL